MARSNINIFITVNNQASKPLEDIDRKLKNLGKSAKGTTADIWQFNKTIFSTIAFLNLFHRAFGGLHSAMDMGAPLERLQTQYERVLGPKGALLDTISQTTNSIVDDQTALESGLKLGQLGLVKSSQEAGNLLAKFAVAARMAGKEGSEGVKDLTDATVGINVAKLEEYGILQKSNPALMAQFAIINKSAGIFGNAAVKMQQMALIQKLITEHTKEYMFMAKSTGELVADMGTSFKNLKQQIGILIATALRPLMEKLIPLMQRFKGLIENIYKNDKQIMFLVKSVLALGAALSGLLATLGSLKLAVKLLGFAGVGFPGVVTAVIALGAAFIGLTKDADGVIEKFKVIGAILKGVYELVTNLDPETGMSKISKSTRDLLEKYGLLGFTKTIARVIAIIKTTVQDVYKLFKNTALFIDRIFGGMFEKFKNIIASFTSTWTTWWTSDALNPIQKFVRAATVILAPLLTFLTFKGLKWGLGKITGGFFGGGSRNDGSSPTKALWVQDVGRTLSGLGTSLRNWIKTLPFLRPLFSLFTSLGTIAEYVTSYGLEGLVYAISESVIPVLRMLGAVLGKIVPVALILGAAFYGIYEGISETADEWGKLFTGIFDITKAIFKLTGIDTVIYDFVENTKFLASAILDTAKFILIDIPMKILEFIKDLYKNVYGSFGMIAGSVGQFLSNTAKNITTYSENQNSKAVPLKIQPFKQFSDDDIKSTLQEQMANMSEDKRSEMQTALENALKTQEKDGQLISPEEFSELEKVFKNALDSSENLTTLVNKQKHKSLMQFQQR